MVVNVSAIPSPGALELMVMLAVASVGLTIWYEFTVILLASHPVSVVPVVGSGFHSVFAP